MRPAIATCTLVKSEVGRLSTAWNRTLPSGEYELLCLRLLFSINNHLKGRVFAKAPW